MEAINDIIKKHKNLFSYVSEKTGISISSQKEEIKDHVKSLLRNPESGFTEHSSEERYEGIIYEHAIRNLLKIKKSENRNYDYIYDGKEIEFKTAFRETVPIKGKLVGQEILPYEKAKEIFFITNKEPPFIIYKVSRDILFELINKDQNIKKYFPGEMAGPYEKIICFIPTNILEKEVVLNKI